MPETAEVTKSRVGRGKTSLVDRVTANLPPRAALALERIVELTGYSKTDSIIRAIQVYAYLEEVWSAGGSVSVTEKPDAEPQQLKIL
ncbi:hypothetical protein [Streptomyces sp. R33]|uniref:Ribbon-helix-helix protein CopG domain-containing protein n=1 Tax=Streptomyces sp. R33 TaxID=3238629 RepID=A0AB39YGQ6_9ACTN